MAEQRYEYYCDVVETGRFDRLHGNLDDMGRKGWGLVHVLPYLGGFAARGHVGDLLLVWERPIQASGERRAATVKGGLDG